jgi:hypothetical protein
MYIFSRTNFVRTSHEDVATGVLIQEEGIPLVYVKEAGITKVKPSIGAVGEIFAGLSISRNAPPTVLPLLLSGLIASDATFELPRAPITGQLFVSIDGTAATVVTGTPAAGEVKVDGLQLVFEAGAANSPVFVQMMYSPSLIEARSVLGDAPFGGLSTHVLNRIGVFKSGEASTTLFDASVDWSAALHVKLADGKFTAAAANDAARLPNVVVTNSPSVAAPFLSLNVNVA